MKVWYLALLATLKAVPALAAPFAYVPNGASCTVSVIDTADDSVVASVTETRLCGASGVVISVDGTQAYVRRHALALDGVTVIDTATESVITEVFTGPGSEPAGLAVTPDGASLYVALAGYSRVAVIDTASLAVSGSVSVADFIISPQGVAITSDGASVYVAGDSAVAVIDTATSNITGIAVNNGALDVAITPDGDFAYVSNGNLTFGVISVINTTTSLVVAIIPVLSPQGITITPDGTRAYVANTRFSSVQVLDLATNSVIATVFVSPGTYDGPKAVAITPDGSLAYVAGGRANREVAVIDTASQMVVDMVPVGTSPGSFQGIAITPQSGALPRL